MKLDFFLKKWSVWPPLENKESSSLQKELLSTIPKMLRRRLSLLAKTVFCAASPCLHDGINIPTVFSSTHGELAKSFQMMEQVEKGEEISPTLFSLSVHNAIAGLFSMAYKNKLQSTVVAPGEIGIAAAFIEAVGLLQEGEKEVLIVLYDEPLVEFYPAAPFQLTAQSSVAVALRIARAGQGVPWKFSCLQSAGNDGEQPLQVPLLLNFLSTESNELLIHTPRQSWQWVKKE